MTCTETFMHIFRNIFYFKYNKNLSGKWIDGGREGQGSIISPRLERLGVSSILGNYRDGILSGRGKVTMTDGSVREGWFQHGYFHGPARYEHYHSAPCNKTL